MKPKTEKAIALGSKFGDVILILDDLKTRQLAIKFNFKTTGALCVIIKSKQIKSSL